MRIRCECGWEKEVKDELNGKKGKCPKCNATMLLKPYEASPERSSVDVAKEAAGNAAAAMGGLISRGFSSLTTKQPTEVIAAPVDPTIARLTEDAQDPAKTAVIIEKVQQILTAGEAIEYIAIQARPVVNMFPDAAVLTNRRFIIYRPKMLGRVDFEDYIWRELHDAKLSENMIGATLTLMTDRGMKLELDYLPKVQARKLYRIAQQREEASLDERRERKMEEQRAAAGGVTIQTAFTAPAAAAAPVDPVAKLGQLKQMLDAGLISQGEFDQKKASILASM